MPYILRATVALLLMVAATAARAQSPELAPYMGVWGCVELSDEGFMSQVRLRSRDFDYRLRDATLGFQLSSTMIRHQRSDPNLPVQSLGRVSLRFQKVQEGVWQTENNEALMGADQPYAWAFLDGRSLVINVLELHGDGRSELHTYRRTITDDGLDLAYTIIFDGTTVQSLTGRLTKYGD